VVYDVKTYKSPSPLAGELTAAKRKQPKVSQLSSPAHLADYRPERQKARPAHPPQPRTMMEKAHPHLRIQAPTQNKNSSSENQSNDNDHPEITLGNHQSTSSLYGLQHHPASPMSSSPKLGSLSLINWQSWSGVFLGIRWMKKGLVDMPKMSRIACLKRSKMVLDPKL
jgi:hypothetical protein